jgi:hypothetical protein
MIKIGYYLTTFLTILGCYQPSITAQNPNYKKQQNINQSTSQININNLLSESDAEKILGEPAHLSEKNTTIKSDVSTYNLTYSANSKDQKTGITGIIYFLFEEYKQISFAKKYYSSIKTANQNHQGVVEIFDIGDEAYFHSDGTNFYFIMVRKAQKIFIIKVNKITGKTSLDEFNRFAKNLSAEL